MDDSCINSKKQYTEAYLGENALSFMPPGFRLDLLEFISAFISFAIGYYALKAYKISSKKELLYLFYGFMILGLGMLVRVVTTAYIIAIKATEPAPHNLRLTIFYATMIYSLTQLVAYSLFTIIYVRQAKETSTTTATEAAAIFPLIWNPYITPFIELIAIVLLGYVATQVFMNCLLKRTQTTQLVALGFTFMFFSHLFFLFTGINIAFYMLGQLTQLTGFLFLLVMLAKVSRTT